MFLIREIPLEALSALGLVVLWLNLLLIAGMMGQEISDLWALLVRFKKFELKRGRLTSGVGTDGAVAIQIRNQIGRSLGDQQQPVIGFADRGLQNQWCGGDFEDASGRQLKLITESRSPDIWLSHERVTAVLGSQPVDAEEFARDLAQAKRITGLPKPFVWNVRAGDSIWILGRETADGSFQTEWLGEVHPFQWLWSRLAELSGVVIAILGVGGLLTAGMLMSPANWEEGLFSARGAFTFAGFAYFLGVQPVGVWARMRARTPDKQWIRHRWVAQPQTH